MATKSFKDSLLRGIALLGLIVILVLGAWGIILLAFNLPSFLGGVSQSISGLFTRNEEEPEIIVEEPETPEVVTPEPTTPAKPTTPVKPVPTTPTPTYVYTPAPAVPQLYGNADLSVRILSVVPQGNRYVMQFEVQNVGTNIAASGWNFNALLPLQPQYVYQAPGQQALRPGDRILYTLGFERPYGYDYDDCPKKYTPDPCDDEDDERYDDCNENFQRWDLDEWEDWYEDVFDRDLGSRDDWDEYDWETWYEDFCDDRDDNDDDRYDDYYYPNYGTSGNRMITITVDPYNRVYEQNEYNNTANQNVYW